MNAARLYQCAVPLLLFAAVQASTAAPASDTVSIQPARTGTATPYLEWIPNLRNGQSAAFGPGTGTLGITSVTLSNVNGQSTGSITISGVLVVGPGCQSAVTSLVGFSQPIYVPVRSTVQLTFPTPLVIQPVNGLVCYGITANSDGIEVLVNGFVN